MATPIKDKATAEHAAQNLNQGIEVSVNPGEPAAPKVKTTSEKLFPEFTTEDGGIINRPVKPFEDKAKVLPVAATPSAEPQGQTPTAQVSTAPNYLTPEDVKGKMAKLKVDGIEQDVPAEDLFKASQLERALNSRMENLAKARKELEAERAALLARPAEQPKPQKQEQQQNKKSAEVEALEAKLEGLYAMMLPAIQESGIKRVEQMAKEKFGTDDFRNYFDQIRQGALDELAKPEIAANPQARAYFDSDAFYFQKYQEVKLRELTSKPKAPEPTQQANVPVLTSQSGTPIVLNNQGQPVSLPAFEGSGGVPSRQAENGNGQAIRQQAFDAARREGTTEAWMNYYKLKSGPSN